MQIERPKIAGPGSRPIRPILSLCVLGALLAGLLPATAGAAELEARASDPVVLTGAQLRFMDTPDPDALLAFRWSEAGWEQVPVQVDERDRVDFRSLYPFPDENFVRGGPLFINAYTDPGTLVGPDSDPTLDDDDEIAMMASDAGEKAPNRYGGNPDAVSEDNGVEVKVRDPINDQVGYLYLFGGIDEADQGAGRDYVSYEFNLLAGDFLSSYGFADGPNPEASTVDTDYYSTGHSDRWIDDQLRLKAGASTGVDILDREKAQFFPGFCGRSTDSFAGYTGSAAEGTFIANRDGPVRAIRSYLGANSGPYTQRESLFYERRQEVTTFLRVHAIPQVMQFTDYSPEASGMTYRNQLNPDGVTIDGVPDTPVPGVPANVLDGASAWEQVSGPQGSVDVITGLQTDIEGLSLTSYYLDNAGPGGGAETQCTGDGSAYGSSGTWIDSSLPNTDPRSADANFLSSTRTLFYAGPGASASRAEAHRASVDQPLSVTTSTLAIPVGGPKVRSMLKVKIRPVRKRIRAGKKRLYRVRVKNPAPVASGRLKVCLKVPGKRVRLIGQRHCRTRKSVPAGNRPVMSFRIRVRNRVRHGARPRLRFKVREDGKVIRRMTRRLRVR